MQRIVAALTDLAVATAGVGDSAEPVVSLRQSREFLQSLLALHRSAETGTVVFLSYDDSSHGVTSWNQEKWFANSPITSTGGFLPVVSSAGSA